jgi:hypothetical protein
MHDGHEGENVVGNTGRDQLRAAGYQKRQSLMSISVDYAADRRTYDPAHSLAV